MKLKIKSTRFTSLLALFTALGFAGAAQAQLSSDIVPRTDAAYALLADLAARRRIPGHTSADFVRGDRLYTRAELARIIETITPPKFTDEQAKTSGVLLAHRDFDRADAAERFLRERFAVELHADNPDLYPLVPDIKATSIGHALWLKARAESNPDAFSIDGQYAGVLPFARQDYVALTVGNSRDEWYPTHSLTGPGAYGYFDNAYVYVGTRVMNLTLGKMPVRWGPGYSGALLIGDEEPSMPILKLDKSFVLPGKIGSHVGRIRFEEFTGTFFEAVSASPYPDANGTRRYLSGKRLVLGGGPWQFQVAEALKSSRMPDPEWAYVLPLYFYQNDWTDGRKKHYFPFLATTHEPDTYWKNYQGDATIGYTADRRSGLNAYTDVMFDDIKALPGTGSGFNTPQKLGAQFGVAAPHIGGENGRFGARVEYTSIDPGTYTNQSITNTWTDNNAPLGYTAGPNARVLFGGVDAKVTNKVNVALEGETRRPKGVSLPGYPTIRTDRAGLYATYAFNPFAFTGLRVEHGRFDDFNLAAPTHQHTRVEANIGFGL